jgi:hypothetical protein
MQKTVNHFSFKYTSELDSQLIWGFLGYAIQHPQVASLLEDPRGGTSKGAIWKVIPAFLMWSI